MKHVSFITLVLCIFNSIYAEQPDESRKPVKVFLLAGQSNIDKELFQWIIPDTITVARETSSIL